MFSATWPEEIRYFIRLYMHMNFFKSQCCHHYTCYYAMIIEWWYDMNNTLRIKSTWCIRTYSPYICDTWCQILLNKIINKFNFYSYVNFRFIVRALADKFLSPNVVRVTVGGSELSANHRWYYIAFLGTLAYVTYSACTTIKIFWLYIPILRIF